MSVPEREILGWREWLSLPELGIDQIKAKVDTGARTSSLHAFSVEEYVQDGQRYVRFGIHPFQKRVDIEIFCQAPLRDQRRVTDSGGHSEMRYVVETMVKLGKSAWPIEITLTNRDNMGFRMLLGRTALRNRYLVDPGASYLVSLSGKRKRKSFR